MGSLGKEGGEGKKAMWLYPKVVGSSPSERWGHSACFYQGLLYVFGGCCGGMHFSNVLVLNLNTMAWTTLVTTGNGPGPRDSHSATLWGSKMIVFGGTNGSKKVNDLHILDLESNQWTQPMCHGAPPSARESHSATLVRGERLVVFGGSGEGAGNYLNDLHVLDLKAMSWSSPEVKGSVPPPRDSHISVAIGNKLFVYGGDCGNRYLGDVEVFNVDTETWSRMEVQGPSPGRRAGHTAVRIGTQAYMIGGVGDKKYYNDTWILDTATSSWCKLDICGQTPQGRFSHTAIVTDSGIAIYGGCGEDERPLGELLTLQLGVEHLNGLCNVSPWKNLTSHGNQDGRRLNEAKNGLKTMLLGSCIDTNLKEANPLDISISKRKRTCSANAWERETEQEEHSLSVSQNSSPSQSDQETTTPNPATSRGHQFPPSSQLNKTPVHPQPNKWIPQQSLPDVYFLGENRANQKEHSSPSGQTVRGDTDFLAANGRPMNHATQNLIGAEVQGKVDGAFDSGFLMTATVNGRIFRGVLFAPGPNIAYRGSNMSHNPGAHIPVALAHPSNSNRGSMYAQSSILQPIKSQGLGSPPMLDNEKLDRPSPTSRSLPLRDRDLKERSDLQGVVLTLGGPGCGRV